MTTAMETTIEVTEFTQRDREMIAETHAFMQNISAVLSEVMPMLAQLKDSPAGKMLGL